MTFVTLLLRTATRNTDHDTDFTITSVATRPNEHSPSTCRGDSHQSQAFWNRMAPFNAISKRASPAFAIRRVAGDARSTDSFLTCLTTLYHLRRVRLYGRAVWAPFSLSCTSTVVSSCERRSACNARLAEAAVDEYHIEATRRARHDPHVLLQPCRRCGSLAFQFTGRPHAFVDPRPSARWYLSLPPRRSGWACACGGHRQRYGCSQWNRYYQFANCFPRAKASTVEPPLPHSR